MARSDNKHSTLKPSTGSNTSTDMSYHVTPADLGSNEVRMNSATLSVQHAEDFPIFQLYWRFSNFDETTKRVIAIAMVKVKMHQEHPSIFPNSDKITIAEWFNCVLVHPLIPFPHLYIGYEFEATTISKLAEANRFLGQAWSWNRLEQLMQEFHKAAGCSAELTAEHMQVLTAYDSFKFSLGSLVSNRLFDNWEILMHFPSRKWLSRLSRESSYRVEAGLEERSLSEARSLFQEASHENLQWATELERTLRPLWDLQVEIYRRNPTGDLFNGYWNRWLEFLWLFRENFHNNAILLNPGTGRGTDPIHPQPLPAWWNVELEGGHQRRKDLRKYFLGVRNGQLPDVYLADA